MLSLKNAKHSGSQKCKKNQVLLSTITNDTLSEVSFAKGARRKKGVGNQFCPFILTKYFAQDCRLIVPLYERSAHYHMINLTDRISFLSSKGNSLNLFRITKAKMVQCLTYSNFIMRVCSETFERILSVH